MSFTEDLTVFFDTDGHAVTAAYNTDTTVKGILSKGYVEVQGTESYRPLFTCAKSDISSVAHDDTLAVGGTTYTVVGVQPDDVGTVVTLVLSE